ncbi:MAG: hypothetical protein CVV44_08910 [Spirochaetae bacterium HGW-Spirochaetae-1]|jgi:hypothetical protein|nr:MAG: hypothetical protein CVV44_08910 [Spirochaetae bacterium HGW-Spirochaetae-1]
MEKLLLALAFISVACCYYFFFFNINLLYGAIAFIAGMFLNVAYAVRSSVNTLDGYDIKEDKK